MTLIEQLEQVEERMQQSFLQKRFDTFGELLAERLRLLRKAEHSPEKSAVFPLARRQTERWVAVLGEQVDLFQKRQSRIGVACGYAGRSPRSGGRVNRLL